MRRPWVIAVAVVAAGGALWLALVGFDSGVPVETAEVVASPIGQYLDEQAITRLPETCLITMPIATERKPSALVIPRSALFRAGDGQWQVYRVEAGRAFIRPVEVGIVNDEHVEIVAGLEAGDRVIPAPDSNLTDVQRVVAITRRDRRGP